jgi:tetratricopeptide (TPR) repeat protein
LKHYNNALISQKETGIRYNTFWQPTYMQYCLKITVVLQKLGQTEQALAKLREALDVRRQASEIDQANPRSKYAHAEVFYSAGKIFAAAEKFDEALAAYREAETYLTAGLTANFEFRRDLGRLYLALGDLYAKSPSNSKEIKTKSATQLKEAQGWYQKSITALSELREKNFAIAEDRKNANLAEEKLAACMTKLSDN